MSHTEYIDSISHEGMVVRADLRIGTVKVKLSDDEEECGSCPAASLCTISGKKGKDVIEIACAHPERFHTGERVRVVGTERMHRKAIILATVIPCAVMLGVMICVYLLTASQLAAALGGLGATAFFFVLLYLMRDRVRHEFTFDIEKLADR